MARHRQSSNVLALHGAFKHNPARGRARAAEPRPTAGLGDPPAHLDEAARDAWVELVARAHAGTLCAADAPFLEYAAKVWAQVKASDCVSPALGLRFEQVCAKLGMTPADRSRVSVQKPQGAESKFARFAAGYVPPK